MKNYNIQSNADNCLKAFEKQYTLFRVIETTSGYSIDTIKTKNHELNFRTSSTQEINIIAYFDICEGEDISCHRNQRNVADLDKLDYCGYMSGYIGFFKNKDDAEKAYLIHRINDLDNQAEYHSKICDRLKSQVADFNAKLNDL